MENIKVIIITLFIENSSLKTKTPRAIIIEDIKPNNLLP